MNRDKKIYGELNQIAVPLIIQSVSSTLIGLADQILVGRISVPAYSAVGVAGNLLYFITGMFGSAAVAFQIKGSHAREATGEPAGKNVAEMLQGLIGVCACLGAVFALIGAFGGKFVFSVFYGLEGETLRAATGYSRVMCPYVFLQMVIFAYNAYFKIRKSTKIIMWASMLAAALNVALDYVFIFGKLGFPAMEERGAALATVLSLAVQVVCYLAVCRNDGLFRATERPRRVERARELLRKSLPLMGQEFLDGSVFGVFLNMVIARIGVVETGAYLLVSNLLNIALMAMYMYGSATLTLVGGRSGQPRDGGTRRIPFCGCVLAMAFFLPLSALCVAFRDYAPRLISDDARLVAYASAILLPMALANLFNPLQTVYKYALQGADRERFALCATAIVNCLALGVILFLYAVAGMGLNAVFAGLFLNYAALYAVYRGKFAKV